MPLDPATYPGLDALGRIPLSDNFFFREFLYSEVAAHYGVKNTPSDCDLAIQAGRGLCENLLEPLNATFGRIVIRSGYRSRSLNDLCNRKKHNCGSSESNRARHIWDERDAEGRMGACATVLIPWFQRRHARGEVTWQAMAWWIHDHLPYSHLRFFSTGTFNLTWSDRPIRHAEAKFGKKGEPRTLPTETAESSPGLHRAEYEGFPELVRR